MAIYKNYDYADKQVVKVITDTNSGNYLWIAFAINSTTCLLKKVSAFDPNVVYFSEEITVNKINTMIVVGDYLFLGIEDGTNFIYRYSVFAPGTTPLQVALPTGIIEAPVDVVLNGSTLYWLFPGTESGENAKIVLTDDSGTFIETIDLNQSGVIVTKASSIASDGTDLWVVNDDNPSKIYRIYSSGGWNITENNLTS